jgi:ferredoxin
VIRLRVDEDLCQGSGQCVRMAPETFALDDMGVALVRADSPELAFEHAQELINVCPAMAIGLDLIERNHD